MPKKEKESLGEKQPHPPIDEIALKAINFVQKKEAIKVLEGQCKELRVPLEKHLAEFGTVLPKGGKLAILPHADVEAHLKSTLVVSTCLVPEAEDILRKNGLSECLETVTLVRQDVIERLYNAGKIPEKVLSKLYVTSDSYRFGVTLKERGHGE